MASFFKNLFRKEGESQPVPAAPLANDFPDRGQAGPFIPVSQVAPLTAGVPRGTGPFAVVTGRQMTVRELAALLPPGLLKFDGVSPDQAVALPLEELRKTLASGRPSLRLSQVYEACPALFQRPPASGEDVEVTFPLARVRGLLENSGPLAAVPAVTPFDAFPKPGLPAVEAAGSRFGAAPLPPGAGPPGNPFAPMMNAAASGLPGSRPSLPVAGGQPQPLPAAGFPSAPPLATPAGFPTATPAPAVAAPFAVAAAVAGPPAQPFAFTPAVAQAAPAPTLLPGPRSGPLPFSQAAGMPPAAHGSPASPFTVTNSPVPPATNVPPANQVPSPFTVRASAPVPAPAAIPAFKPAAQPRTFPVPAAPPAMSGPPELIKTSPRPHQVSRGSTQAVPLPAQTAQAASQPVPTQAAASFPSPFQAIIAAPASAGFPVPAAQASAVPAAGLAAAAPSGFPLPPAAPAPDSAPPVPAITLPSALAPALHLPQAPQMPQAPVALPAVQAPALAVAPLPVAPQPVFPPETEAAGESMEMSLRAVLRDADPTQLGFAPENVPEAVRIRFPLDLIAPQLSKGRVVVSIPQICQGIPEKFRPAFARASADLRIVVPMSEVFHNLPESARPSLEPAAPVREHQAITTSPFQTPFVIRAEDEPGKQLLDLSLTGFDKSNVRQAWTATQPVGPVELPHAPLPPVAAVEGAAPPVQVELPPLRPAGMMAPAESPMTPPLTRSGMLSRPPGSGTGSIPVPQGRSIPAVKPVPPSATAIRAFPKPAMPPPIGGVPVAPHLPPAFPVSPSGNAVDAFPLPLPGQAEPPAPSTPPGPAPIAAPVLPRTSPALPLVPPSSDHPDDLGESFSAARLSTEPPPRAGSAPVSLAALPPPGSPPPLAAAPVQAPPIAPLAPSSPFPTAPPAWPASLPAAAPASHEMPPTLEPATPVSPVLPEPPARAPVAHMPQDQPTGPIEDLSFGCQVDQQQIVLRALFGTGRTFTPQDIADACAALPGLKACAILSGGPPLVSGGLAPEEATAFCGSVAKTRASLASLAESMGLGSGGNFTLRTDQGVRSFFLDSGLCLAVWHDQPLFSGGTREKLILITQELAKL